MSWSKKDKAVALRYNPSNDKAPIVIASGYGLIAEKIINIGEQQGIPIFRDDSAASMLCMLELGAQIPVELYEIVAMVYSTIMGKAKEIHDQSNSD